MYALKTEVSFPNGVGDYVSGLEMLPVLADILMRAFGNRILLAGMDKARWPTKLARNDTALLEMRERKKMILHGIPLRAFGTRMVGMRSRQVVMYCTFTFIDPELAA